MAACYSIANKCRKHKKKWEGEYETVIDLLADDGDDLRFHGCVGTVGRGSVAFFMVGGR